MTMRHFARLFGIAMAIVGVWLVAGLFTASEFYRRTLAIYGETEHIEYILRFQIVQSLNWAWFTPIVVFIAERLPLRKPHLARNALIVIALLPVLALIRAAAGGAILQLGEGDWPTRHMVELSIAIRLHRNIAIEVMIIVFTNLLLVQREASRRAQRELDAQTLLARAQLDGLRAQLQPNFVFTTLQAIADTIERDAAAADRMIVTLAELLRRSLTAGDEAVPLAEELERVDRGASLYGGGRSIRFDADDEALRARVPALFVQQLVDKAAGSADDVAVRAWRDGAQLRVEVRGGAAPALEASIPWEGVQ